MRRDGVRGAVQGFWNLPVTFKSFLKVNLFVAPVSPSLSVGRCWVRVNLRPRKAVWDEVLKNVADRKVLYLEFGVAYGDSISYWSRRLTHPQSALHGFDSFEGLPEHSGPWKKRQFDAEGRLPKLNDERLQFFQGLVSAVSGCGYV
jgi:hypothetical protein